MKTLASAGFAYILKFIWFIFLALAINITLAITYFDNIPPPFKGENLLLSGISLGIVIIFPIIWLITAKSEALTSAIFKVIVDNSTP